MGHISQIKYRAIRGMKLLPHGLVERHGKKNPKQIILEQMPESWSKRTYWLVVYHFNQ
jgi:hypothetical protein